MRLYIVITTVLAILATSTIAAAERWDLVLLTTSGLNGQLLPAEEKNEQNSTGMVRTFGGFARIQSIFKSYRSKYPGTTITIATGDDLMGESLTNDNGKTIFGTMNMMGFDISGLGNHEFDRGGKFLGNCMQAREFPTVVSNLKISADNSLRKYIKKTEVINKNFVKVGFMGMILPNLKLISNPGTGISVNHDIIEVARKTAQDLRKKQKVDLVILLSHLTIEDQKAILQAVPEIDIICGGQSHKTILPGQEIIARDAFSPGLMVQCGSQGRYIGVLKVRVNNGVVSKHEWTIIPVTDDTEPDAEIEEFISSQLHASESPSSLAVTPVALDTRVNAIRTGQTTAGSMVSSILLEKFNTDIAFQNSGGIRGDKIIPAGPITTHDINTMFPFGNTVTILKISGKKLKQILERSVHKLPAPSGAFLQVAGIEYTVDIKGQPQELRINNLGKPVEIKSPGSRISNIKIRDNAGIYRPVLENSKYTIATNSYLARGGDGYIMLMDSPGKVETFIKVRDVIRHGLQLKKKIRLNNKPVAFNPDGTPFQ